VASIDEIIGTTQILNALLSGRLLEEMYSTKKEGVCWRISAARYLNFTTDEAESIRGDRIANLSLI
jgi:hypothetical protein